MYVKKNGFKRKKKKILFWKSCVETGSLRISKLSKMCQSIKLNLKPVISSMCMLIVMKEQVSLWGAAASHWTRVWFDPAVNCLSELHGLFCRNREGWFLHLFENIKLIQFRGHLIWKECWKSRYLLYAGSISINVGWGKVLVYDAGGYWWPEICSLLSFYRKNVWWWN